MKRIVDRNATFVPACERIFGPPLEVVDDGRAVLLQRGATGVKLSLEAGERELWLSEIQLVDGGLPPFFAYAPSHERRLATIKLRGSIEAALLEAKETLGA
jgi:hypothetical protein